MITIGALLYAVIRQIQIHGANKGEESQKKKIGVHFVQMFLCYLLGVGLSSVILIPELIGFLNSSRNETAKIPNLWVCTWEEYKTLYYTFFWETETASSTAAIAVIGTIGLIALLVQKGRKKEKRILFFSFLLYLIPFISWIMSGLNSVIYDRWEIWLVFCFAQLFMMAWDELIDMANRVFWGIFGVWILMIAIGVLDHTILVRGYRNTLLAYSAFVCFFVFVKIVKWNHRMRENGLIVLAVLSILLTWFTNVSNYPISSIRHENKLDTASEYLESNFWRYEDEDVFHAVNNNQAVQQGNYSTAEYFSIENPYTQSAMEKWEMYPVTSGFRIHGLGMRSILQSLCSVKYLFVKNENNVPYGFEKVLEEENWGLYQNDNCYPIGYTYDQVISKAEFNQMNALEKQVSMLQYAAIEGVVVTWSNTDTEGQNAISEYCRIEDNVTIVDDKMNVSLVANAENYLMIEPGSGIRKVQYQDEMVEVSQEKRTVILLGYFIEEDHMEIHIETFDNRDNTKVKLGVLDVETAMLDSQISSEDFYDVTRQTNRICGKTDADSRKILCMSVPYANGWTAYIDGVRTETFRTNDLFLSIEVMSGEHEIEFRYCTPGIRFGLIITVVSMLMVIGWFWYDRKNKNRVL